MKRNEELLIIDGTALLFRMYFAGIEHQSPSGLEVGGVLGTTRAISRLIQTFKSTHVAIVFDAGQATFRNDLYENYKANRGDPPESMKHQFDLVYDACQALGCQVFKSVGYEADDLIATLVDKARGVNLSVKMVTDDKDVSQLVCDEEPWVVQVSDSKKWMWSEDDVKTKFGVLPNQMVDYLSLIGDSSDNIPGVKGIGSKSASALLGYFGNLTELFERIDEIESLPLRGAKSLQSKLEQGREDALLAQRLVQLKHDVPIDWKGIESLLFEGPTHEDRAFFENLGFTYPYTQLLSFAG